MVSVAIDGWVECRVVIHLELAVELEAARAGEDFAPENIKAVGEIRALVLEDSEPGAVSFNVFERGVGAFGLFAGVVNLQSQDGEAIDDEARRFGVERRCVAWKPLRGQPVQ